MTTGSRWDLLEQSSLYPLVTGRAAEAVLPGETVAVVMADPGNYHVYWEQGLWLTSRWPCPWTWTPSSPPSS